LAALDFFFFFFFFFAECTFNQKLRENLVIRRMMCDTGDLQVFLCNIFDGNYLNQDRIQCVYKYVVQLMKTSEANC